MRTLTPLIAALALVALAGCDRPAPSSSTTVVKEPATVPDSTPPNNSTTIVQPAPAPSTSTTVVQPAPPASSSSTDVKIDASKPTTTEKSSTRETTRIDTPAGSATRTETETTKTNQ